MTVDIHPQLGPRELYQHLLKCATKMMISTAWPFLENTCKTPSEQRNRPKIGRAALARISPVIYDHATHIPCPPQAGVWARVLPSPQIYTKTGF